MTTPLTLTTRTIRATFNNVKSSVQHPDGRWELEPNSPAGISVVNYSTTDGNCGATVNSPGQRAPDVQAVQVPPGRILMPGDVMLVASTLPGSAQCDDMTSFHIVPWTPDSQYFTGPALGSITAPYVGWSRAVVHFKRSDIPMNFFPSVVDIDSLPVNWAGWGQEKPTIPWLLSEMVAAYDIGDEWGLTGSPSNLYRPYGRDFASRVSIALVMLCSTLPVEQKRPLAERLCQMGIDLAGAYLDGRVQTNNGGHFQGRKALIVLALSLLNIHPHDWPIILKGRMQEDSAYADVGSIPWAPGWKYGWRGHEYLPHEWGKPLSEWSRGAYGPVWYVNNYMQANAGPQVGTALAMRLLKLTPYMSTAMDGFVSQWMEGPTSVGARALAAIGANAGWGEDYSQGGAAGFCAAAWRKYSTHVV